MSYQQKDNRKRQASVSTEPKTKEELRAEELLRRAQEKQRKRRETKADVDQMTDKGIPAFIKGTRRELKAATWPTPLELLKWCAIVIATVAFFAILSMVIDNFVATPLVYFISDFRIGNSDFGILDIVLVACLVLSGIASIAGIYMHQGGETEGLSDTIATKLTGGSGQAQRNLDKITLVFMIVFVACLIAMMVAYPVGYIATTTGA